MSRVSGLPVSVSGIDQARTISFKHEREPATLETIDFSDLLARNPPPNGGNFIHFISLDVEGHELEVLQGFPWDKMEVGVWIIELGDGESGSSSRLSHQLEVLLLMRANGYAARSVQNRGVDMFFVKDKYWDATLLVKGWREHAIGSWGC